MNSPVDGITHEIARLVRTWFAVGVLLGVFLVSIVWLAGCSQLAGAPPTTDQLKRVNQGLQVLGCVEQVIRENDGGTN